MGWSRGCKKKKSKGVECVSECVCFVGLISRLLVCIFGFQLKSFNCFERDTILRVTLLNVSFSLLIFLDFISDLK